MRASRLVLVAVLPLSMVLGGCVADDVSGQLQTAFSPPPVSNVAATEAAVRPETVVDPNAIPWQLKPASAASVQQGEVTLVVEKPGLGRIRGTQKALAQLNQPIVPYRKAGRVVNACKEAFDPQARSAGAYAVEANAAGPERRVSGGHSQQVFFRIFYADPKDNGVEVRQASIACVVSSRGQLLKAAPV